MIQILTDSCCDLPPDIIATHQIGVVPLNVFINDQAYKDGLNITPRDLFLEVEKTKKLPKTAAPSVAEVKQLFESYPGDIIFISIGSRLSATYQSAVLATELLPDRRITIIDSNNLSTGIGQLVMLAVELRSEGKPYQEIADTVLAARSSVKTSFIIDTLDYLYMGGRCSAMENVVGSLLRIHPVIEVKPDGTLGVKDKVRGSRTKTLHAMLTDFERHILELNPRRVFITHTGCHADAEYLAKEIRKMVDVDEIIETTAGATVSSHCGPNTIGLIYLTIH